MKVPQNADCQHAVMIYGGSAQPSYRNGTAESLAKAHAGTIHSSQSLIFSSGLGGIILSTQRDVRPRNVKWLAMDSRSPEPKLRM